MSNLILLCKMWKRWVWEINVFCNQVITKFEWLYLIMFFLGIRFVFKCKVCEICTFWDSVNCCLLGAGKDLLWQPNDYCEALPFRGHPTLCRQRRWLYLVNHESWPLGQFLCGDNLILALQHLLNLRSLHPVCADCCFVSLGRGPRDWVGTVLRTVFCCWPC